MSATMRRLEAATVAILREAASAGTRPPLPPKNVTLDDVVDGVAAISEVLGGVTALHQLELVEQARRMDALHAAVAQLSAHLVAIAEYVKYEAPDGLHPLTNEDNDLQDYIAEAAKAADTLKEGMVR